MYDNIGDIILGGVIAWCLFIWMVYKLYLVFGLAIVYLCVGVSFILISFFAKNLGFFLFGLVFVGMSLYYFMRIVDDDELENYNREEEKIANQYGIIDYTEKDENQDN